MLFYELKLFHSCMFELTDNEMDNIDAVLEGSIRSNI